MRRRRRSKSNRSSSVNGVAVKLPLVFLSSTIKVV